MAAGVTACSSYQRIHICPGTPGPTFEQQKQFLFMQMEHENFKYKLGAKKKQTEAERIGQTNRKSKVRFGKWSGEDQGGQVPRSGARPFNINHLQSVPWFNGRDPDAFFCAV